MNQGELKKYLLPCKPLSSGPGWFICTKINDLRVDKLKQ